MKRFLSILLAILMLAVMLPVTAMAAEGDPAPVNGVWNVTPANAQDVLDGKYGSIDGTTIVLGKGDYGQLELGRATAYPNSNTKYYTFKGDYDAPTEVSDYDTAEALKTTLADTSTYHGNLKYTRSLNNVTIKAADGAAVNVAGVSMQSAHIYGTGSTTVHDYVLDRDIADANGSFWLVHHVNGIKFVGLNFTGNVNIASSLNGAVISGFTFDGCSFTTNGTASSNGQALRYYNEINNGQVSDLTVKNCTFTNCHQGVYTSHIKNVTVKGCTFDTTGHNAIAIQDFKGTCDHGNVVITGNTFKNVGDRIIRFNNVGEGTTITISNNTSVNSGDSNGEIIKATTLPEGMEVTMINDNWGKVGDKDPVIGNGFIETTTGGTITIIVPSTEETPKTEPEKNPTTGANDMVAAAVALMAVSTLGMAVLSRKK